MAPKWGESICDWEKKRLAFQEATRDFLTSAHRIIQTKSRGASDDSFLNRYYRLEVNSQIDPDELDIDSIIKSSKTSVFCYRCGCRKQLKTDRRQQGNKSRFRRDCRRLKGIFIIGCSGCKHSVSTKLKNPRSLTYSKGQLKGNPSVKKETSTPRGRRHVVKTSQQSPEPRTIILPKISQKQRHSSKSQSQTQSSLKKNEPKQMVRRKVKTIQQGSTAVISKPATNQKTPQYSSRLRAFSCLLKQ